MFGWGTIARRGRSLGSHIRPLLRVACSVAAVVLLPLSSGAQSDARALFPRRLVIGRAPIGFVPERADHATAIAGPSGMCRQPDCGWSRAYPATSRATFSSRQRAHPPPTRGS